MRASGHGSNNVMTVLLSAGVALLAGVVGSVAMAERMADIGPRVGDIMAFTGRHGLPDGVPDQLTVARADRPGVSCVIDLRATLRHGGSFVIEGTDIAASPRYRVHWAGDPSVAGPNCGPTADLLVDRVGIEALIVAAGGVGVSHKHLAAAYMLSGAAYDRD